MDIIFGNCSFINDKLYSMNVLLIGSGGREHALSWKMAQSPKLDKLFIAPGNAGTALLGENVPIKETDFDAIKAFVLGNDIKLVVVGPEAPLVAGIHDFFLADADLKDIPVIGPQKAGAELEGSKEFAKEFMMRHNIPTAAYQSFHADNLDEGYSFLESLNAPYVLKADGLAAGKGVLIIEDLEEAKSELRSMIMDNKFGSAGAKVVIEEFLSGIEMSCFVLTDGKNYKILPNAKDYKRIGEGDTGLNTGGMGAISPVPFADAEFLKKVEDRIVRPTVEGIQKDELPYKGFVFIGLIRVGNDPFVIEYNVRLGDPETEVVMPRIKSDMVEMFQMVGEGRLDEVELELDPRTVCTVMMVSGGYPEAYEKGKEITGLKDVRNSIAFHAGTTTEGDKVLTNGGRVIAMTSYGNNPEDALAKSYSNLEKVKFDKKYYRGDIGFDL